MINGNHTTAMNVPIIPERLQNGFTPTAWDGITAFSSCLSSGSSVRTPSDACIAGNQSHQDWPSAHQSQKGLHIFEDP